MAIESGSQPTALTDEPTASDELPIARELLAPEGVCAFDFFQAVRLLGLLGLRERVLVGEDGPPEREIARFLAHVSLAFPASNVQTLLPGKADDPPLMTVNFMGLMGPSGVLPRHYTERMSVEMKKGVPSPLQEWLDLFNHRFISFFYRAWEKYRFFLPFERSIAEEATALVTRQRTDKQREVDAFSRCLFSLIGLGFRSHRQRFRVAWSEPRQGSEPPREQELGRLDDFALLRFSGMFAHRPRNAVSLEIFLQTYLQMPVKVLQFQGQWFHLSASSQTSMGMSNNHMGINTLIGDRIWDVQSKVRIVLGPLSYEQFVELLPERLPRTKRKRIFLLAQLVRYYLGAEMDFDFQLVLKKEQVPPTQMGTNSRLGWNTWSKRRPYPHHATDTVFSVTERTLLNE